MRKYSLRMIIAIAAVELMFTGWVHRGSAEDQTTLIEERSANDDDSDPGRSKAESEILRQLNETALELSDKSLQAAVKYLEKKHHIPIQLDLEAFKDAGLDPGSIQISIDAHGITLRSVLRLILEPSNLAFLIKDEALQITTKVKAGTELVTQIYDVRGLLATDDGGQPDFAHLSDLLRSAAAPTSWNEVGGNGSCEPGPLGTLVISQTQSIQEDVKGLFSALRRAKERIKTGKFDEAVAVGATMADKKIKLLLSDQVNLDFENTSIKDVAESLQLKHIEIQLDESALKEAGIDPTTALVSMHIGGIALSSALHQILNPFKFASITENESLVITSKDKANSKLGVYLYPIGDLVEHSEMPGPMIDDGPPEAAKLLDCITFTVARESWSDVGGNGTISIEYSGNPILVIAQTSEVHEQIADLLAQFREVHRKQQSESSGQPAAPSGPEKMVLKVYELRVGTADSPAMSPQEVAEVVQGIVQPENWPESDAYIRGVTGKLIVRQVPSVHREIWKVLDKIGASAIKTAPLPPGGGGGIPVVGQNGAQPGGGCVGFGGGGGF